MDLAKHERAEGAAVYRRAVEIPAIHRQAIAAVIARFRGIDRSLQLGALRGSLYPSGTRAERAAWSAEIQRQEASEGLR